MSDDQRRIEQAKERYNAAAHGMQTGVAVMMERGDGKATTPKHLRVGVNSAMVETSVLAQILIDKGIVTQVEFIEMLALKMEQERDLYQSRIEKELGTKVTLR